MLRVLAGVSAAHSSRIRISLEHVELLISFVSWEVVVRSIVKLHLRVSSEIEWHSCVWLDKDVWFLVHDSHLELLLEHADFLLRVHGSYKSTVPAVL